MARSTPRIVPDGQFLFRAARFIAAEASRAGRHAQEFAARAQMIPPCEQDIAVEGQNISSHAQVVAPRQQFISQMEKVFEQEEQDISSSEQFYS